MTPTWKILHYFRATMYLFFYISMSTTFLLRWHIWIHNCHIKQEGLSAVYKNCFPVLIVSGHKKSVFVLSTLLEDLNVLLTHFWAFWRYYDLTMCIVKFLKSKASASFPSLKVKTISAENIQNYTLYAYWKYILSSTMSAFKVYAHALNSSKNVKPLTFFAPCIDSSDHGTYIRKYVGTCCALVDWVCTLICLRHLIVYIAVTNLNCYFKKGMFYLACET